MKKGWMVLFCFSAFFALMSIVLASHFIWAAALFAGFTLLCHFIARTQAVCPGCGKSFDVLVYAFSKGKDGSFYCCRCGTQIEKGTR